MFISSRDPKFFTEKNLWTPAFPWPPYLKENNSPSMNIFACSKSSPHNYFQRRPYMYHIYNIHTLRVHYAHAAANLNSGYSKYAKVARVHYFCTIALRTYSAVLTRAWASRRVDLRERRIDLFSKRVIILLVTY